MRRILFSIVFLAVLPAYGQISSFPSGGGGGGGGGGNANVPAAGMVKSNGTALVDATAGTDYQAALGFTPLNVANSLSELTAGGAPAARTNLGLGSAATQSSSSFLATANNLSDLASSATSRTNLGLGTAATQASSAFDAAGTASSAVAAIPTSGSSQTNPALITSTDWATFNGKANTSTIRRVTAATDTATTSDGAIICSATSNSVVETLPPTPSAYETFEIKRVDSTSGNSCTLTANTGQNIEGGPSGGSINVPTDTAYRLRWESGTSSWWLF